MAAASEIVLLSGMHRSGTSALARVCNLLGARLPEPLVPPSLGNELGHWEPAEVVAMNDRALLSAGGDVNSLHALDVGWRTSHAGRAFVDEIEAYVRREASPGGRLLIKDPRISLLATFWREAVERTGAPARFLIAFRDPSEVARSLARRQLQHFPDEVWTDGRVVALWLRHHLELEQHTRGALRSFVAYDAFLRDWRAETGRAFAQLELDWGEADEHVLGSAGAAVKPEARRERHSDKGARGPADATFALLDASRADPEGGAEGFDDAWARFDAALTLFGDYLFALERRVEGTRAREDDLAPVVDGLREARDAAERRAVELASVRAAAVRDEHLPDDAGEADDLHARHGALQAAHGATIKALREARAASLAELERVRSEAELRWQAERREREAIIKADRERARAEQEERHARELAARESSRVEAQQAYDGLVSELADHREAFERMRAEAATERERASAIEAAAGVAAESERKTAAASLALAIEGERKLTVEAAKAAELAIRNDALEAELAAVRAEGDALRRSHSWRVTRPLRSVAFRLRRR